jgi:hypothetical protein
MFGVGILIAMVTLLLTVGKAADGTSVRAVSLVAASGVKAWLYFPAMLLAPWLLVNIQSVASAVGDQLFAEAGSDFAGGFLQMIIGLVTDEGGFWEKLLNMGGTLVTMLAYPVLLSVINVLVVIELIIADISGALMLCLLPVAMALAIYPKFSRLGWGLIGVLIGLTLVKPAIGLAMWIAGDNLSNIPAENTWMYLLVSMIICLAVGALPPMVLAWVLPNVAPDAVRAAGSRGLGSARSGGRSMSNAGRRLSYQARAKSSRQPRSTRSVSPKPATTRPGVTKTAAKTATPKGVSPATVAASAAMAGARKASQVPGKAAGKVPSPDSGKQPYQVNGDPTPPPVSPPPGSGAKTPKPGV